MLPHANHAVNTTPEPPKRFRHSDWFNGDEDGFNCRYGIKQPEQANGYDNETDDEPKRTDAEWIEYHEQRKPNNHAPNARERSAASQAEQAEIEEEREWRRKRKRRLAGEPEEPKRTDAEWIAYHTSNVVTFPTRHAQTKPAEKKPSEKQRLRDSLNNHLCGKLADCDTSAKLIDAAQSWNSAQPEPLPSAVVEKCARKVWRDFEAGHLKPWRGQTSKAAQDKATAIALCRHDPKHGGDAWLLLTMLRHDHAARCARGETFNITPTEMVAAQVIPGWSQHRYERARDLLLKVGLIELARPYKRRCGRVGSGAEYRFPESKTDSGERRGKVRV